MNYRDVVTNQINHNQTEIVPYTLNFQKESRDRLDLFYGSDDWRIRIKPFISPVWTMDFQCKTPLENGYSRDIYGSVWKDENLISHLEKPILAEASLEGFIFPETKDFFINNEREHALKNINMVKDVFTIIHIPWGIFEKSWSLRGFEDALADMALNINFYEELSEIITKHIMEFVDIAIQFPVDGIMFGDDWGGQTGLFMGAERWRKFFKKNYKLLYDKVHQSGKFVLNHCCGNIVDILPDLIDIGLDVYESFQPEVMDINKVKKEFGKDITFWGGLGAQSTIPFGSPKSIKSEVLTLKNKMTKSGGFILAPSKDPPPETPIENLIALIDVFGGLNK